MKLQDALKRIIMEFGISALKEKRLVFLLSDYKAFDDYPAVKPIMKSIVEDGYGNELCRLLLGPYPRIRSSSRILPATRWTASCP